MSLAELVTPPKHNIRRCTPDDIPWMMALSEEAYPGNIGASHAEQTRVWMAARLQQADLCFVRGERTCGVANLVRRFYAPDRLQCYVLFLYSRKGDATNVWEPFHVLDALRDWGKDKGATAFWVSDNTETDFGPYVKRRGGRLTGHNYVIDLDKQGGRYG